MTSLRAAVYIGMDRPLQLETLELDEPGPGEVAVRIEASGLCHSDLHVMLGEWSERPPMVLGHEGCGVVESVGEDVHQFAPGDRAVLCWYAPCDECARCRAARPWVCLNTRANSSLMPYGGTRLRRLGGEPVRSYLAVGSFGQRAVVPASGAVRVDGRLPAELGALIGCGVATGVGAVTNTAAVQQGQSAVVVGWRGRTVGRDGGGAGRRRPGDRGRHQRAEAAAGRRRGGDAYGARRRRCRGRGEGDPAGRAGPRVRGDRAARDDRVVDLAALARRHGHAGGDDAGGDDRVVRSAAVR